MLALVPAEAAKEAQVGGQLLLEVEADAVLFGALEGVVGDDRDGGGIATGTSGEGLGDLRSVVAHVGVVDEAEKADGALEFGVEQSFRQECEGSLAIFELNVLAAGAAKVPLKVDAIRDGGHKGDG